MRAAFAAYLLRLDLTGSASYLVEETLVVMFSLPYYVLRLLVC
jgi:hypothetical protein